ncbi:hypothetical protein PPUJ20028_06840 [Pseudomonas putida]|uniref:Uncharacterized protein n=1 Tax=Pseudomonas putida TaxID=303 RepID=A0AA37RF89_PSEPU|nr:hypothetical protein PPUJ20028_06840 [Pseudomonas putida]GLO35514.1 hypothetical protein PPUN14671_23470 [Pseudomonas putida]
MTTCEDLAKGTFVILASGCDRDVKYPQKNQAYLYAIWLQKQAEGLAGPKEATIVRAGMDTVNFLKIYL